MESHQINGINSNNLIISNDEYNSLLENVGIVPTSDFLLSTISFWNNSTDTQIFNLGNAILLALLKPPYGIAFTHLLVNNLSEKILENATQITRNLGLKKLKITFGEVSESLLDKLNLQPETDEFEYIYNLNELAQLQGSKYKKQRNAFAKAQKENSELYIEIANLADEKDKTQLKEFCEACMQIKSERNQANEPNLHKEWLAFQKCIDNSSHLNLKIIKLYANKKISGLLIYEEFNNEWIVGHFFKTYLGLGMYLLNQLSVALAAQGFKYFNFQEDRGVESLRYFKQQLNPTFQLKTYSITI